MSNPPAEPSPRALGESLAALAAQLADLRGQVQAINDRLDQAGLHADLNLAARFEDLAQTVADALEAAAPRAGGRRPARVCRGRPHSAVRGWVGRGRGSGPAGRRVA